jgi:hypothetical protein
MTEKAGDRNRGADKLYEQLFGSSETPSEADVKRAIGAEQQDYQVLRWWWKGTPPMFLEIYATLAVERERAGELVQQLISNRDLELSVELSAIGAKTGQILMDISNVPKEAR